MSRIALNKPTLVCLYGYPGSGKSYVARNLEETLQIANVSADRIRHELFSRPKFDLQENAIVSHLMNFLSEEFLRAGVSVVYDTNAMRSGQRRHLREMAHKHQSSYLLVWLQTDTENAFARTQARDRRTLDDKYSEDQTKATFQRQTSLMQNPQGEDYLVVSGKHSFVTQKSAILNRLYQMGLVNATAIQHNVAKPELVNLIPSIGSDQVDFGRRNINIT